ncbi:MAG: hypothetical protein FWE12_06445 [Oscillospiraceae bacterium]|nr:hypothetical protein [Oscillospiraceae bacterium]
MDLYKQIFLRKSCRKYQPEPLDASELQEIEAFIRTMRPLFPEVTLNHRILGPRQTKALLAPKAPHYLVISGNPQPHRDLCVGFLFQQLDLYLSARGLGACWLGGAKGRETPNGETDILSICFGRPAEPATRTSGTCKRKSLAEIATGEDSRLEAARLAPSGINLQPWYFIAEDGVIHVYQAVRKGLKALVYNLQELDVGIALCHLMLASEAIGKPFQFESRHPNAPPAPSGFAYVGTVL